MGVKIALSYKRKVFQTGAVAKYPWCTDFSQVPESKVTESKVTDSEVIDSEVTDFEITDL